MSLWLEVLPSLRTCFLLYASLPPSVIFNVRTTLLLTDLREANKPFTVHLICDIPPHQPTGWQEARPKARDKKHICSTSFLFYLMWPIPSLDPCSQQLIPPQGMYLSFSCFLMAHRLGLAHVTWGPRHASLPCGWLILLVLVFLKLTRLTDSIRQRECFRHGWPRLQSLWDHLC